MPINTPVVIEIDKKTWLIQEYGLSCCYALLGNESGLLIDAGCGRMNIRRLAERLFEGRPYDVVLTSGHASCSGGVGLFDRVFCAETVEDQIPEVSVSADFSQPTYLAPNRKPEVLTLHTGDVFDLGGREVLCIRTPGFSGGSCSFYDRQSGIAFVGNACAKDMKVSCVADALTGLMLLKKMTPGLNRMYPLYVDYTDYRALPATVLEDAIGACRAALAPDGHHYHKDGKVQFRFVTLEYDKKWADLEPHSPYPLGL